MLALCLLPLLAWEASGLDLALAHAMGGSASGFALRDNVWLSSVLHSGARQAGLALALALALGIAWPWGMLKGLTRADRVWLLLCVAACALMISLIKRHSASSCPWSLSPFGGAWPYVPHWRLGLTDGGPGNCFPAGHASTGFAFFPLVWLMQARHRQGGRWLLAVLAVLAAGLGLGLVQQWRGAHFMSHTLWTGWCCAAFSLMGWQVYEALRQRRLRQSPALPVQASQPS